MTSYQHERYVAEALDGILAQSTDFPFEVLVGDDASTDGTRAVIARYAKAHPDRIQTYFPEHNLGGGGKPLFAELIRRSRGQYLAQLDADDYWTSPDKLARQVAFLDEHPECSMCFHNVICHYEDGSAPDAPYSGHQEALELGVGTLLDGCQVASCTPLFRREAIDPLPDWYFDLPWGDWPMYFIAAQHGRLWYMPHIMGVYRIHSNGMYNGSPELERYETLTDFYEHLEGIVPPEFEGQRRLGLSKAWVRRGLAHERLGEREAARTCLRESLRLQPFGAPSRYLPPYWGTGERRRMSLWLRLKVPAAWARPFARRHRADAEEQLHRQAR
jgi:glycosyltransferase involved in cell wall biosynthesis